MKADHDAVVIGAGPYGLSTAAHLRGRGLSVATFGKTLEMWRSHMPEGMLLRSHGWASNLSDPGRAYGFLTFLRERGYENVFPVPLARFVEYGLWFKERAVPDVDETYVAGVEWADGRFVVTLEDGRQLATGAVVVATGPYAYAHRPASCDGLLDGSISHSCEHGDFSRFHGKQVLVIGGGQSAIEYAALLHEAGAATQVAYRRRIQWLERDRAHERTLLEKLLAPDAQIAEGWGNWVLDHFPYLFYRLPQASKDNYNSGYRSGASAWLRERVVSKVTLHESQEVTRLEPAGEQVLATLSGGATLRVDHVVQATGYRVGLGRLMMIHPALRARIATDRDVPILNDRFESCVPGLYFVGMTSVRAYGPLFRFVAGCGAAAARVASAVARNRDRNRAGRPREQAFDVPRPVVSAPEA